MQTSTTSSQYANEQHDDTVCKRAYQTIPYNIKRGHQVFALYSKRLSIEHIHTQAKLACNSYTHIYAFAVNVMTFMQAYFYTFRITHAITFSIACK